MREVNLFGKTLLYDEENGRLFYKSGKEVGWLSQEGYRKVTINWVTYYVHRLIFYIHNGYFPEEVDHKDRTKSNNRIGNLRDATHLENMANQGVRKNNSCGEKNIDWHKASKRWRVSFMRNYKITLVGYFKDFEEAVLARDKFTEL